VTSRACLLGDLSTALARVADVVLPLVSRVLAPHVLFAVPAGTDAFALTFDDGPHPVTTPGLLDVLDRHGATATFFLIGERARSHPELVAAIAARGHELGNHLMRDEPSVRLSSDDFRRQLAEVTAMLESYGRVRWFRPGSGWFTPQMLRSAADLGLGCALGTVVVDHARSTDRRRLERSLILRIRAGSLAVLHEGRPDRRDVVASTDAVLAALCRRGLLAVSLTRAIPDP
jgi:peptidoglycan/xylan/chitin deacetylase (PgdA/CDA1 family)